MLPGGGYRHLAPREGAPAARWLAASLGVGAAVLRYRLPPRHGWPAPLEDAKAALALLRSAEASARWGVDPSRVALLGFSAGLTSPSPSPPLSPSLSPSPSPSP